MLTFYKYQGTGNDFIIIDDRKGVFDFGKEAIMQLCDRRFGVGADGLILLQYQSGYDFRMVYFNSDGNEGTMCGNGGRCMVKFAYDLGIIGSVTRFIAVDGEHHAAIDQGSVWLGMQDSSEPEIIQECFFLNTGSPHLVIPVSNSLGKQLVRDMGRSIRNSDFWSSRGGVNVNFIQVSDNKVDIRTYERGVEDETLSCGTGSVAAALVAHENFKLQSPVTISTRGGELLVSFDRAVGGYYRNITLAGPAVAVFKGMIPMPTKFSS